MKRHRLVGKRTIDPGALPMRGLVFGQRGSTESTHRAASSRSTLSGEWHDARYVESRGHAGLVNLLTIGGLVEVEVVDGQGALQGNLMLRVAGFSGGAGRGFEVVEVHPVASDSTTVLVWAAASLALLDGSTSALSLPTLSRSQMVRRMSC